MWVEIDRALFKTVQNHGYIDLPEKVEAGEFAHKSYYFTLGCRWLVINNYVSAVTQYYIEDINA